MSLKDLNDYIKNHTPEEQEERQALKAYLTVLKHKKIVDAVDIDVLADVAENGVSERDRVRAAEKLNDSRQHAADALAHNTAVREEILEEKGLSKKGPASVTFNVETMPMDKLRALARGEFKSLNPGPVIEAEVVRDEEKPAGSDPAS